MGLIIVDGTNLAHRAYYALKNTQHGIPISPKGVPIASCSSVLQSLLTVVQEHNASHLAVAFDNAYPTFRHELYPQYKSGRKEKEDLLVRDIQTLQTLLIEAEIGIVAPIGYEADDVVATLRKLAPDLPALIYSNDRDLWQLIDQTTTVLCPSKGKITPDGVQKFWGIKAEQVTDYKGLRGDSTDNIPGVRGIGKKLAGELLSKYESVEDIYANIGKITGSPYTKLKPNEEIARLSKNLATLEAAIPLNQTLDSFALDRFRVREMAGTLATLGLDRLADRYSSFFCSVELC